MPNTRSPRRSRLPAPSCRSSIVRDPIRSVNIDRLVQIKAHVGKSVGWIQARLALLKTEGTLREAAMAHPELLTVTNTLLFLEPHEREPLFARVRASELNVEDLRALVRAKRTGLRRLERSVVPSDDRRVAVALEQQPVQTSQDAVVVRAVVDHAPAPYRVVQHPADNPEGQDVGLTVDNGVDCWGDSERRTKSAGARAIPSSSASSRASSSTSVPRSSRRPPGATRRSNGGGSASSGRTSTTSSSS